MALGHQFAHGEFGPLIQSREAPLGQHQPGVQPRARDGAR